MLDGQASLDQIISNRNKVTFRKDRIFAQAEKPLGDNEVTSERLVECLCVYKLVCFERKSQVVVAAVVLNGVGPHVAFKRILVLSHSDLGTAHLMSEYFRFVELSDNRVLRTL